ncbi:hybrid sensor histidine kinase/response regulator [Methylocaldum szegediense]|uniref:histidine kinase n=1 Tax=Methylocaldum szegediense TaxID=73780 RepID=A0ABM9I665_9GAMM|nr:ATP-binding protein [Methylocaldum szegediense]CAI8917930.1 Histidine kinase [Methylocaldum szegediense]
MSKKTEKSTLKETDECEAQSKLETLADVGESSGQPEHASSRDLDARVLELETENRKLRETLEAMHESRDRYVNLFDFAPAGYLTMDERGIIREINLTAAGMLARQRPSLIGLPFVRFVAKADQKTFLKHLSQSRNERRSLTMELRLVGKGGWHLPVEMHTSSARDDRHCLFYRAVLTDTSERLLVRTALDQSRRQLEQKASERTAALLENRLLEAEVAERKRLEAELRQRMQELADADRHKDEFMAMLAHELRNPLAAIVNATELMRRKPEGHADLHDWACRVIKDQTAHLARLLDDLLDVARVTQGKIVLENKTLDLRSVVSQAIETNRAMIDDRRHHLKVRVPPEPVWVYGDGTRCVQIIGNLIHNAAKFTDVEGQIEVVVEIERDEAIVRVRDNGTGISPDLLPRIFEPFTQEDRSLARSRGGLGIGLSLVKKLVELHNGKVEVFSEGPDRGSEFVIRLPTATAPSSALEQRETNSGSPAGDHAGQYVLVVDDNASSADSLSTLLQAYGYRVQVVYDGKVALDLIKERVPDVVLLDIGMPQMDGYEVALRMRDDPRLARTRLIAVSGYGQEEDRQRSRKAGFDHHLVKPVDIDILLDLLGSPSS